MPLPKRIRPWPSANVCLAAEAAGQRLVLLTPLETQSLGDDLLGRLCKAKLIPLSARESLKDIFQAQGVHPYILANRWFAETLLECVPSERVAPAPSGFLDLETAWGLVLSRKLGIAQSHPDTQDLLAWSADDAHRVAWQNCRHGTKRAAAQRMAQSDSGTKRAYQLWIASKPGHGKEAAALGLAFHVVSGRSKQQTSLSFRDAAVRLGTVHGQPAYFAGIRRGLEARRDRVFRSRLGRQGHEAAARECLQQSDELLRQVQVDSFAYLSDYSPRASNRDSSGSGEAILKPWRMAALRN